MLGVKKHNFSKQWALVVAHWQASRWVSWVTPQNVHQQQHRRGITHVRRSEVRINNFNGGSDKPYFIPNIPPVVGGFLLDPKHPPNRGPKFQNNFDIKPPSPLATETASLLNFDPNFAKKLIWNMYFPIFGTCLSLPLEHCISFFGKVILRELWLFFGRNILVETVALLLLFLRKLKFCSDSSKPASSGRIFETLGPNSVYTVVSWLNWPPSWKILKQLWDCQKTWGNQTSSQTWRNAPVEALWRTLVGLFFFFSKMKKKHFWITNPTISRAF